MFGSLKSMKACKPRISYWLICQETRNEVGVNAPRLSVLGLFGFRKVTYTPSFFYARNNHTRILDGSSTATESKIETNQ